MKVKELIEKLKEFPEDKEVYYSNGTANHTIEKIELCEDGDVNLMSDIGF